MVEWFHPGIEKREVLHFTAAPWRRPTTMMMNRWGLRVQHMKRRFQHEIFPFHSMLINDTRKKSKTICPGRVSASFIRIYECEVWNFHVDVSVIWFKFVHVPICFSAKHRVCLLCAGRKKTRGKLKNEKRHRRHHWNVEKTDIRPRARSPANRMRREKTSKCLNYLLSEAYSCD